MSMLKRVNFRLALIVFLLLSAPVAVSSANAGPASDHSGGPRERIEVTLHAGGAPAPGGTVEMILSATPLIDAPDLVVNWGIPAGALLAGSARESFGAVSAGETVESRRVVSFPSAGTFKVWSEGSFQLASDIRFAATGVLFFTIQPQGSELSDRDPHAHSPMGSIMEAEVTSAPLVAGPQAPMDDPCFSISGTIQRWDRPPTTGGYGAQVRVPVRNAWVEIREEDIVFDDSYLDLRTDANGNFSGGFCDDDGWFDDELEIYVRLHAEIYVDDSFVAEIIDSSYIDEVYEYRTANWVSEGGSHTFNIGLDLNQSAVFNIADAVLDAWTVWRDNGGESGGDALFDDEGEVHWEPGYGDDSSYYLSFWGEMTIADDPSDPDAWDDSVIIHEWGHMADDIYSCDDNPGGDHFINQLVGDSELSWGEAYPDYWQSMVRDAVGATDADTYIDINGSGSGGIMVNLETTQAPALVSVLYEMAIAGALWDLYDSADDGQDTISHGQPMIQEIYTGDTFESVAYGFFDDDCNFDTFARAWVQDGKPADAATAAAILQNTGYTLPPAGSVMAAASPLQPAAQGPTDAIWWNQLTYVVDNSQSMSGAKFNAVKTVLLEAINDLGAEPEGTEFSLETFNNSGPTNQQVFAGQFFPERLLPAVNGLAASGAADGSCTVGALSALAQAVDDQFNGHAWLFTDGDTVQSPTVENITHFLNTRGIQASMALMGVCPSALSELSPEEQQQLQGAARRALGLAAEDVPGGVVPYLLTAINSGGQFLFVDETQAANAADILRAQITHSAGAGSWSDYVSDFATYRWDELATWEYDWIDATAGTDHGTPSQGGYVNVGIPLSETFSYYDTPYTSLRAYEDGYLVFNGSAYGASDSGNDPIPNTFLPNNALYPYWDNLDWQLICAQVNGPEGCGAQGKIYSLQQGDWFAVEHRNYYPAGHAGDYMNFETLLNVATGEIRFQYADLAGNGAGGATIGIEDKNPLFSPARGIQVSHDDVAGASNGMGYKFLPAPPQPTKTYTVAVDSAMSGVGFLLTGYSGDFEPLVVRYPGGGAVNCADTANVLCLDLGLVQYIQADVDGRTGDWEAVVDAGPSGEGTFSFFSFAASALSVEGRSAHNLTTLANSGLLIDLGQAMDGNMLTGQFVLPTDELFGGTFTLYDDGAHGDSFAGDGLFGANAYTPPGAGSAYLSVSGQFGGVDFIRIDPVPYSFQPLKLESLGDGYNYGGFTALQFELTNLDAFDHCYTLDAALPEGWSIDGVFGAWCLNPNESTVLEVYVNMGSPSNTLPSGASGEVTLTAIEVEEGVMSATDSATVTRARPPANIMIHNPSFYLRPGGDTSVLAFMVTDSQNVIVADGTQLDLSATLGAITPSTGVTAGGYFTATFTSGASTGVAVVTADFNSGAVVATTEIQIHDAVANNIQLSTGALSLPAGGAATSLEAVVTDRWGNPLANEMVQIGVEGDEQLGLVNDEIAVNGMTDSSGRFLATFTSGELAGYAGVRAELLVPDGAGGYRPAHADRKEILIGTRYYLPFISHPP